MEPPKVEKFSTTDRGNGLRAAAPLRPGELLFRSDPLAYTVCKGSRGVVCDRCLLGYVRSALGHLSPVGAARGTARPPLRPAGAAAEVPSPALLPWGSPGRGAADRLRQATPWAALRDGERARGAGRGIPGSVPAALQRGAGPANTPTRLGLP